MCINTDIYTLYTCEYAIISLHVSLTREKIKKTAKRQRVNFAMWYIVWPLDGRRVSVFVSSNCRPIHGAAFGCWLYVILLFWLPILYCLLYFAYCILLLLVYHSFRVTLFVRRYCNIYFLLLYTLVLFGSYDYDDDDYDYNDV